MGSFRAWVVRSFRPLRLPKLAARASLEWPGFVLADPAPVELAGLRCDAFAVDQALIEWIGIECKMVTNAFKGRCRLGVRPCSSWNHIVSDANVPIPRLPLPLAKGSPRVWREVFKRHIVGRDIVGRWMASLQRSPSLLCISEANPAMTDLNATCGWFGNGRAGVIPDAFLARLYGVRFWMTKPSQR